MKSLELPVRNLGDAPEGQSVVVVENTTELAAVVTTFLSDKSFAQLADGSQYIFNANATTGGVTPTIGSGRWYLLTANAISPEAFGAIGNFNPTTGAGNDDRAAIQSALEYAASLAGGGTVVLTNGKRYYLGSNFKVGTYQLNLDSAVNVKLSAHGAEIFLGASGSGLAVTNSLNCSVEGGKWFGYCGGVIDATREHDNIIAFASSKFVSVSRGYFTNCLGDCVYIGGNGNCQHVKLFENTFKERYGNGVRSSAGGTRSRLCVAVIDAYNVSIDDNTIIGGIDFENNLATQYLKACAIRNNNFVSGYVTPNDPIAGPFYWVDEAVDAAGGTVVDQGIQMSGPGFNAATQYSPLIVSNNRFESALLFCNSSLYQIHAKNNHFDAGLISLGDTSGTNSNNFYVVTDNTFNGPLVGETSVIKFGGDFSYCEIARNKAVVAGGYVMSLVAGGHGVGGFDAGRNVIENNKNVSDTAAGVYSWTEVATTVYQNNWWDHAAASERGQTCALEVKKRSTGAWPVVDILAVASKALNYITDLTTDTFILANTGGGTLGSITNVPDGTEISIEFDAGGITVVNSGSIRLKGGVNAVSTDGNSILTLVARAGLLFEKCRNF